METEATFVPYGAPAITTELNSSNLNSVWVVARSATGDHWINGTALGTSTWGTWTNVGHPSAYFASGMAGSPSVVSWQNNSLFIFSNDSLGRTWHLPLMNGFGSWAGQPYLVGGAGSPYAVAETATGDVVLLNSNPKTGGVSEFDFLGGGWQRGHSWSGVKPY
jgi:hypothetical protein